MFRAKSVAGWGAAGCKEVVNGAAGQGVTKLDIWTIRSVERVQKQIIQIFKLFLSVLIFGTGKGY